MYDINRQVCIVSDAMEAEKASQAYCREARAKTGLAPDDSLWIPSLSCSTAYRLGELCERTSQKWAGVMDICGLLDIRTCIHKAGVVW